MIKHRKFVVAIAVFGMSSFAVPCITRADEPAAPREVREQAQPLALPAGFTQKAGNVDDGIRKGLVKLTDRAVSKNSFNSMLGELSAADRERAREFKGVDQGKLDVIIDKIQKEWKAKYNQDFKIPENVFDDRFQIIEGEVSDPAVALTTWPVPATMDRDARTAGEHQAPADQRDQKKEIAKDKLNKGRKVAVVRFPEIGRHPGITVSMIHHLPMFWRIDIPDDRTGEQIYNDLVAHLTHVSEMSDKWPADVNEAYRIVAYHACSAIYGVHPRDASRG